MTEIPSALHVDGLAKRYGRHWVLAHVGFSIPRGSALLVTGANGAGKSTLLGILATALPFDHGRISVAGHDLKDSLHAARRSTAFVGHLGGIYRTLSARENLSIWTQHLGMCSDDQIGFALDRVGLAMAAEKTVDAFSAGMRRRLALARALLQIAAGQRDIVLLDEPYEQLDRAGFLFVDDLIDEWRKTGLTVVLATHLIERALPHSSHVIHLDHGRARFFGHASSFDPNAPELT